MANPKKVRFDGLDCAAITAQIRSNFLGSKVANIYDGKSSSNSNATNNTSTYLLKLVKPVTNSKHFLLIESGIRFHLTEGKTKSNVGLMPSPFVMKLRKCLNNRRLELITQLGNMDRVVDLRFGSGTEGSFHLIIELYAKGNLILTKHDYEIVALLRSHEYSSEKEKANGEVKVAVGQVYPVTFATTLVLSSNKEDDKSAPENTTDASNNENIEMLPNSILDMNGDQAFTWIQNLAAEFAKNKQGQETTKKKKRKGDSSLTLKMALLRQTSGVYHYGPSLIDHCILSSGLQPGLVLSCTQQKVETSDQFILDPNLLSIDQISLLLTKLKEEGANIIKSLMATSQKQGEKDQKGYILYESYQTTNNEAQMNNEGKNNSNEGHGDKLFLEFQPHLLHQHSPNYQSSNKDNKKTIQILEYDTFSQAVDNFFSHLDVQRRILKASNLQSSAQQKLANIQADQNSRMEVLKKEQGDFYEDAQWIEQHAEIINDCIMVVNSALDSGMDWDDLANLVEVEQQNGNPVASLIHALDLENDAMLLKLQGEQKEESEEGEDVQTNNRIVQISLDGNAYQNARMKYQQYRQWKDKATKTQDAHKKALQAAEVNVQKQLMDVAKNTRGMHVTAGGNIAHVTVAERKPFWFEKFHWFITSDNYLVLAGRDAHQNETLVKRYLRPGDAYLHADVFGASSCILRAKRKRIPCPSKNKKYSTKVLPLSEQALREAGHFTICNSSAWSTKMITSAWYVESHQVSKTAPSGEYLTVGSFMVRGKKNYLQPVQLEMGLGILYALGDAASIARHRGERRDFALQGDEEDDFGSRGPNSEAKEDAVCSKTMDIATNDVDSLSLEKMKINQNDNITNNDSFDVDNDQDSPHSETAEVNNLEDVHEEQTKDIGENKIQSEDKSENEKSTNSLSDGDEELISPNDEGSKEESKEESLSTKSPAPTKRKGISVKERRLMKKYGSLEKAREALAEAATNEKTSSSSSSSKKNTSQNTSQPQQQKLTRGKKNKAKRAAKRYADQDDEDRELALLALHGNKGKKDKKNKKKSSSNVVAPEKSTMQIKAAEETIKLLLKDTSEVAARLPDKVRDVLASCVSVKSSTNANEMGEKNGNTDENEKTVIRWDKFDADVLERLESLESIEAQMAAVNRLHGLTKTTRIDNFAASLAGILRTIDRFGYEHLVLKENETNEEDDGVKSRKSRAEKQAEKEAWNKILAEDGTLLSDDDNMEDEEAIDDTAELAKLTAKPLAEDVLLCAIPVCAPYYTLSHYKYSIKLTPGSLKRGKAAKQCIEILMKGKNNKNNSRNGGDTRNNESEKRNNDLIKQISHNELVQAICGEVKIAAAGASKIIKNNKKKSGKKKGGGKKN